MRLIIISNRLPITIKKTSSGFEYKQTSGGLVTGLKCVQQAKEFLWLGNISGIELSADEQTKISQDCWDQFRSVPLFVPKELNEKSYNGFCNKVAWPLNHAFVDNVVFNEDTYDAYVEYNQMFCKKVCEIAKEGDVIWVHDYHLMLLPRMLREKLGWNVKIAFFLHTPFSSPDCFLSLPVAKDILKGIVGSDSIGFHLWNYVNEFIECCKRVLKEEDLEFPKKCDISKSNLTNEENESASSSETSICTSTTESDDQTNITKTKSSTDIEENCKEKVVRNGITYYPDEINTKSRKIQIHAVPIGIDPEMFRITLKDHDVQARIAELKKKFEGKKIILGVDRTDYIKGIPQRMQAFSEYLKKYDDTVFFQVAVPSRTDVIEYKALIDKVKFMAAEINSSHGCSQKIDDTKVYLLNKSVDFKELCALYAVSDICLITSLRDGMNLVALEYVACQEQNNGVLVLSEFAGAATTLTGSVICNPWDIIGLSNIIRQCVEMNLEEKKVRYELNKTNIDKFTALDWAEKNLEIFYK